MPRIFHLALTSIILFSFYGCYFSYRKVTVVVDPYYGYPKEVVEQLKSAKAKYNAQISSFSQNISKQWGAKDIEIASTSKYVKYTNNYKSRAIVNFNTGKITVQTIDTTDPRGSLYEAIMETLLTPDDPTKVDLYTTDNISYPKQYITDPNDYEKYKDLPKPYLAGLIKDNTGQIVLYPWRANNYANYLITNKMQTKKDKEDRLVTYVTFDMLPNHAEISSMKYSTLANKYAKIYNIAPALILAIIKTESSFNPFATSAIPAYGLMQIVPSSAGADAHKLITGIAGKPSKATLFDPESNIKYGTAYLSILYTRYLSKIKSPLSLEYCVIAAYNTGSGNVLRSFARDRNVAIDLINQNTPKYVYNHLKANLPFDETRRYIHKVTTAKSEILQNSAK